MVPYAVGARLIRGAFAGVARRAAGGAPKPEPAADAGPRRRVRRRLDHARRLLHVVADRLRWQTALAEARRRAAEGGHDPGNSAAAA
jgi:hypothetical protein